jgi:hypothetical protein
LTKYFDGFGNDVTSYVVELEEKVKLLEAQNATGYVAELEAKLPEVASSSPSLEPVLEASKVVKKKKIVDEAASGIGIVTV